MPGERHPTVEALRSADLRGFLASRFFGVMGRSLLHTALVWHVFDVTRDELWLGVLGGVEFLPVIPVAFVAGARHHALHSGESFLEGPVMVTFVIVVAAVEAAVGLALVIALYRRKQTVSLEALTELGD